MKNPWKSIPLSDYENHMKLDSVLQLQTLNAMMKEQLTQYSVHSVMIFGVAGGNGLEHIDSSSIQHVYGVDINPDYLKICEQRFPNLQNVFHPLYLDLTQTNISLPQVDLIIANLLIEYLGYHCFQNAISKSHPAYVSCAIQIDESSNFISDSPYLTALDGLSSVHHSIQEDSLTASMKDIGYDLILKIQQPLPNGKKFLRLDFQRLQNAPALNI